MSGVEERLDKVEERLDKVEGRLGSLENGVQKLRVLGEQTTSDLKLAAEVQGRHGEKLDEITKALEPLARMDNFVKLVAHDHESRIQELEKRTGVRNPWR